MKYQLLIKDIHKHTERAGLTHEAELLRKALNIMTVVPKAADDMMHVGRIKGFEVGVFFVLFSYIYDVLHYKIKNIIINGGVIGKHGMSQIS